MAVSSLAAMGVWIAAPAALSPRAMAAAHAIWTLIAFGWLFLTIGGHRRWADRVTGFRVLLCPVLFAAHALDPRAAWWKVGLALVIIALDRVDGEVARREGTSERGAVFDMESDAFYLVTMSAVAHLYLGVTALVFIVGGMRPLYVCAWAVLRRFIEPSSPNRAGSLRARLIHVALVVALMIDLAPLVPLAARNAATGVAILLILYSYAVDFAGILRPPSPG